MKYHIALKFLAVLLCTCFLLTAAAAGLGIVALAGTGLYSATMQEVQLDRMHYMMYHQAEYLVMTHLLAELEQMPQAHAQEYAWSYYSPQLMGNEDLWFYTIADESGKRVDQRYDPVASLNATKTEFSITVRYPVVRHVYTYDSIEVVAYDEGQGEHLYCIYLVDPNISTDEGLCLGDSVEKMIELYGENYTKTGSEYAYYRGDTILIVLAQGGMINAIEIRMAG
jgi:hypothetical protein